MRRTLILLLFVLAVVSGHGAEVGPQPTGLPAGTVYAGPAISKPEAAGQPAPPVQPQPAPAPPVPATAVTEADVVGWVFDALITYPTADQPYIRFIWLPPYADPAWVGATDWAVNMAAGHGSVLVRGTRFAGGYLLAYDLRTLAPEPSDLLALTEAWDGLALDDCRFHIPQVDVQTVVETVDVAGPIGKDGKPTKTTREVKRQINKKVALLAPHLSRGLAKSKTAGVPDARLDAIITQLTRSTGGVYPADFFIEQALTSAKGKYIEFRNIKLKGTGKKTAIEVELAKFGYSLDGAVGVHGDKGALILVSGVTGKSRVVLAIYGPQGGLPLFVTFDYTDENFRPDLQFIRNLVDFFDLADAGEWFVPLPNGMVECLLTNKQGDILRTATDNVVADDTKPGGHTKQLEGCMSCACCHGPNNGYKTAVNDMSFFIGADADFLGDFTIKTHAGKVYTRAQALDIVVSRFGQRIDEPDGPLGRARRDAVKAAVQLTDYRIDGTLQGLQPETLEDKLRTLAGDVLNAPSAHQQVTAKIKEIRDGYRYRGYDAVRFVQMLDGLPALPPPQARARLRVLVPRPAPGVRQDELVTVVKNGATVNRDHADTIYPELAAKAALVLDKEAAEKARLRKAAEEATKQGANDANQTK